MLEDKISEVLEWLDNNSSAEKEEFDSKRKELEDIAMPIMSKLYSEGDPGEGDSGPKIEEVD